VRASVFVHVRESEGQNERHRENERGGEQRVCERGESDEKKAHTRNRAHARETAQEQAGARVCAFTCIHVNIDTCTLPSLSLVLSLSFTRSLYP